MILELYEFSRSNPDPEEWLLDSIEGYESVKSEPWDTLPFVEAAMEHTKETLEDMESELRYAAELCEEPDGPAAYADTISSDIGLIRSLRSEETFGELQEQIAGASFARLAANKDKSVSEEKTAFVKSLRDQVKRNCPL